MIETKPIMRFYQQYRDSLFAYLLRFTGDSDLAGEIMQESFTRYLERYGDRPSEPRLLYTIGRNAAQDAYRRKRQTVPLNREMPDADPNQEQRLIVKQACRRMQQALSELPEADRDVLLLATSGDLTYREIAAIVGITEANVKVRVHRARVKLRNLMKKEDHGGRTHQHVYR
jgi:RNA polymerase sigma-70 factor (ECF subfamily)